jgi:hypothetical protein
VLAITTDNASNNDTFIKIAADMCKDEIHFCVKTQHVRCFAHILNLSAQDGLAMLKATAPEDEDGILSQEIGGTDVIPKVGL